jgi:Spy/CpxP family protein refolding chaperone
MRRKIAISTMGLLVLLAAAIVTWAQEGAPQGPNPAQGQHRFGGGPHQFGGGPGGFGAQRMGWQGHGRHEFGGGGFLMHMAENPRVRQYLGLTDEQVGRLHKIGVDAEKASVQTRADLQMRHIELRELMRADNPDHDAIMQKLDEVNALEGKMSKQRAETMLSARSVLTPEQQKKMKTFMENRGAGGGPGREGMMQHRGVQGHGPGHPGGPGGPAGAPHGSTAHPQAPPAQ